MIRNMIKMNNNDSVDSQLWPIFISNEEKCEEKKIIKNCCDEILK